MWPWKKNIRDNFEVVRSRIIKINNNKKKEHLEGILESNLNFVEREYGIYELLASIIVI